MPKASTNAIITIIRNAQRLGVDIDELQRRVGIDSEALANPDQRIDSLTGFRLMSEAEILADDPLFGLYHGQSFQPADMGLVGFLILNASTTKQALTSFCQFQRIYGEGMIIEPKSGKGAEKGRVEILFNPHPSVVEHCGNGAFYSHMSGLVTTVNWLQNRSITPLRASVSHKKPTSKHHQQELEKIFGKNIKYSATNYALCYDEACFNGNVLTNNPELFSLFEHRAENIINQLDKENGFKAIVASCILKSLDGGKPNLENISSQLCKSTRTVQRLLKLEETTFQQILDEVRKKSAIYYLTSSSLNIDEITYLLGFSDASAFRKSFRKWSQETPEKYRKINNAI